MLGKSAANPRIRVRLVPGPPPASTASANQGNRREGRSFLGWKRRRGNPRIGTNAKRRKEKDRVRHAQNKRALSDAWEMKHGQRGTEGAGRGRRRFRRISPRKTIVHRSPVYVTTAMKLGYQHRRRAALDRRPPRNLRPQYVRSPARP